MMLHSRGETRHDPSIWRFYCSGAPFTMWRLVLFALIVTGQMSPVKIFDLLLSWLTLVISPLERMIPAEKEDSG